MSRSKQVVLVGFDLGISVASAAFLLPGKNAQPTPVSGWPGADDIKNLIVPCCVRPLLAAHHKTQSENDWGYFIQPTESGALLLNFAEHQSQGDAEILHELRHRVNYRRYLEDGLADGGKSLLRFIVAALKHVETRIAIAFGKEILLNVEYRLCITVPPWWGVDIRGAFISLIQYNGVVSIEVICQPTASLTYFLLRDKKQRSWQVGDTVSSFYTEQMITTVYTCIISEVEPKLSFTKPKSHVLTVGSFDLTCSFKATLKGSLKQSESPNISDQEAIRTGYDKLLATFERFISNFDGTKHFKARVPWSCPDDPGNGIVGGEISLDASVLRSSIFGPILTAYYGAIEEKISFLEVPPRRTRFLFSGILSECPYILKSIEDFICDNNLNERLETLHAVNGYTSASRGAALYLDKFRKKVVLDPLPCSGNPEVRRPLISDLPPQAQADMNLEIFLASSPEAGEEVEYFIRAYKLTMEVYQLSDQATNFFMLTSLMTVYKRIRHTVDTAALRAQFSTIFMKEIHLGPPHSFPSELLFVAAMFGAPETLRSIIEVGSSVREICIDGPVEFARYTALHFAVHLGNIPAIEWLLTNGAHRFARTAAGYTSLHLALSEHPDTQGVADMVHVLITTAVHGFRLNLNIEDNFGMTALDRAEEAGLDAVAFLLRSYGAKNNAYVENLFLHSELGNAARVQQILREHPNLQGLTIAHSRRILQVAAERGHDSVLGHLLSEGMGPNMTTNSGLSALHFACREGHRSTALLLLKYKADITLHDVDGITPLHTAAQMNRIFVLSALLQSGAQPNSGAVGGWTALHFASEIGSQAAVETLISFGANIESQSHRSYGWTQSGYEGNPQAPTKWLLKKTKHRYDDNCGGWRPLHVAAHYGHVAVVKTLIKSGADPNAVDLYGYTPLHRAAQNGKEETVNFLLESNVISPTSEATRTSTPDSFGSRYLSVLTLTVEKRDFPHARDQSGKTALHGAIESGQERVVKLLLKKGFDSNSKLSSTPWTALSLAVQKGFLGIVKLLLQYGADPNIPHGDGSTALHVAAKEGLNGILTVLLVKGSVKVQDHNGDTPLHQAAEKGHLAIAQALLAHDAEINAKNNQSSTPLLLSITGENFPVSKYLIDNGANLDLSNELGMTPMRIAIQKSDVQLVWLLIFKQANFNGVAIFGQTPLDTAATKASYDNTPQLFNKLAQDQENSESVAKALFIAIEYGQLAIVDEILSRYPIYATRQFPNQSSTWAYDGDEVFRHHLDGFGWTPLHLAAWFGYIEIVRSLVKRGADPNSLSTQGKNAAQMMELVPQWCQGHTDIVNLLLGDISMTSQ